MSHRIVSLGGEEFRRWASAFRFIAAFSTLPILTAGVLNLLFIEAGPPLKAVADFAFKYSQLGPWVAVLGVLQVAAPAVFNDDFREGPKLLLHSLIVVELAGVVAPMAAVAGSAWAIALFHPQQSGFIWFAAKSASGVAIVAAFAIALLLVVSWLAGRLLRR